MTTALFSVAGAVALIASVFVVTSRRIVHAALWLVVALGAGVVLAFGNEKIKPVADGSAQAVGTQVFKTWVLPFEVLSVLLLAALIGAIALSQRKKED